MPDSLSDDHSELAPLLPIPNRTVKRLSADDSVDYPCESRSSSDSLINAEALLSGGLCRLCRTNRFDKPAAISDNARRVCVEIWVVSSVGRAVDS